MLKAKIIITIFEILEQRLLQLIKICSVHDHLFSLFSWSPNSCSWVNHSSGMVPQLCRHETMSGISTLIKMLDISLFVVAELGIHNKQPTGLK